MAIPNPSSPLADGLNFLWSADTGPTDLVTEVAGVQQGTAPPVISTALGNALHGNGSGWLRWTGRNDLAVNGSNQFTAFMVVKVLNSATGDGSFMGRVVGTWRFNPYMSGGLQQWGSGFLNTGGKIYNPSSGVAGGLAPYNDKLCGLLLRWDGTTLSLNVRILEPGEPVLVSETPLSGVFGNSNDAFALMSRGGAVSIMNSGVALVNAQIWGNKALSQTDQDALFADPLTLFTSSGPAPQTLTAGLLTNAQAFYSATISQTTPAQSLTAGLFTNGQTFYAPTVAAGVVTLTPGLVSNGQTFYSPTVSQTIPGQTLTAPLLTNAQTFYAPTVVTGDTLSPPLLTNAQTFYSPTVVRGAATLSPALVSNAQSFYSPTIEQAAPQTLTVPLVVNVQEFYQHRIGDEESFAGEIDLTRWYVKRGKKLHIFDRADDADAFIDAERQATNAVVQAQKTSRRARKRVRERIVRPEPIQTVDIDMLSSLLRDLNMRVDLPALVAQQDFDRVMEVMARAVKAQADRDDELDIEMLLLA